MSASNSFLRLVLPLGILFLIVQLHFSKQFLILGCGANSSTRGSFFFSSRRRHPRFDCDWSSDVCSSDLTRRHCCTMERSWLSDVSCLTRLAGRLPRWTHSRSSSTAASTAASVPNASAMRSEERRVGKGGEIWGGAGSLKKKNKV